MKSIRDRFLEFYLHTSRVSAMPEMLTSESALFFEGFFTFVICVTYNFY